ncbi:MAG: hypothetical protein ACPG5B_08745 [Chitinophagales bacterium]
MGFNISGVAINHNFDKDLKKLNADFGWHFQSITEVTFDRASKNWTPEDEVYVYFSDKATLIFLNYAKCLEPYALSGAKVLTFAYSATSMAFFMSLWDNQEHQRTIMEIERKISQQRGEKLPLEKDEPETDSLIFDMIDEIMGQTFFSIDFAEKAYLCQL